MVGPFMLVSVIFIWLGGALFLSHPVVALALTALGAAWNGTVYAAIQRMAREAKEVIDGKDTSRV
jgi:hypothetical protein